MVTSQEDVTKAISASPRRLKQVSNETPTDFAMVCFLHVSELGFHDALLVGLYRIFKLL